MKKDDMAKKVLLKLLSISPTNREYILMLVGIFDTEKNEQAAIGLLTKLAKTTNDPAIKMMLGERYMWIGDNEESLQIFTALKESYPENPLIYRYLGDLYSSDGNNLNAIESYLKNADLDSENYYPHMRLGEIYRYEDRKKLSNKELDTALNLLERGKIDLTARIARARIYGLLGKKDESNKEYNALLAENPNNIEIVTSYVETLIEEKAYKKALSLAEEYRVKYPKNYALLVSLSRIYSSTYRFNDAEEILSGLLEKYPDDPNLKISSAYLAYDRGDWYRAYPEFEALAKKYPHNKGIQTTLDDLFMRYRPYIIAGFGLTRMGGDNRYGPYLKYTHPVNSEWSFEVGYTVLKDTANVVGFDPNFSIFTQALGAIAKYKPYRNLSFSVGMLNQLEGYDYAPAPIFLTNFEDPVYGRAELRFVYNRLFDDPVEALYFDGRTDRLHVFYENIFFERLIFTAKYRSNWYRVDGGKTDTGGGDDFGREDVAGAGLQIIILKKPEITIGYDFTYSKLHTVNNYLDIIPLIAESERHDILVNFHHEWNKWLITDLGGFVGDDPKRDLKLSKLELYGFNITQRVKVSKRLEILGHYEYSSEDLYNDTGKYQFANLEVLYRF